MITLLATVLALKLVEGTSSLEFDGWDGLIGTGVACWLGGWAAQAVMALVFIDPGAGQSLTFTLWLGWGISGIATIASLLIAWAVLPGVHVRRFYGLVLAAVMVAGCSYLAIMLMSATGWGLL